MIFSSEFLPSNKAESLRVTGMTEFWASKRPTSMLSVISSMTFDLFSELYDIATSCLVDLNERFFSCVRAAVEALSRPPLNLGSFSYES